MSKQFISAWRTSGMSLGATLSVALLLSLLAWVRVDQAAYAASDQPADTLALITVNTNNPAINDDGLCSLIEAVENANANALIHDDCVAGTGNDTISLPTDVVMIFTTTHNLVGGGNALPVITDTMTILGNGTALARDATVVPLFRFFNVAASGNLTLNNLRMHNGRTGGASTVQLDLGGGAVVNQGRLQINDSTLSNNRASFGGAIYSEPMSGSLSVNNSTFSSNLADVHGGAIYNFGPGVIDGGTLRFNEAAGSGGAILHDSSTLTLTNLTIVDNIVAGTGAGITARALVTDSHLWIEATDIISNAAAINGGGIYNTANNGYTSIVEVEGSRVIANRVTSTATNEGIGGGILNGWASGTNGGVAEMHVSQSSVLDNVAQSGGGIANIDATGFSTRTVELLISQSTLARNTAAGIGSQRGSGGGLFNSNGHATVANSTLSGNQALGDDTTLGGRGGGIGNFGRGITTTLQIVNSTLAFNQATQAGGGIAVLGQVVTRPTTMEVGNTLIVSNVLTVTESISNAAVLAALASPQVISGTESCSIENGSSSSLGGNIEDGTTCGLDTSADSQDTLVVLGALADNGGPTFTHLITKNNPAFDSGVVDLCAAAPVNGVDQRGVTRPQVARCDIGAVELEPIPDPISEMYFPEIYLRFSFQ
jgi:hypothetical protein